MHVCAGVKGLERSHGMRHIEQRMTFSRGRIQLLEGLLRRRQAGIVENRRAVVQPDEGGHVVYLASRTGYPFGGEGRCLGMQAGEGKKKSTT